jgi:hypothetical protein
MVSTLGIIKLKIRFQTLPFKLVNLCRYIQEREVALSAQLAQLRVQLADIQKEHKDEEMALRKKVGLYTLNSAYP